MSTKKEEDKNHEEEESTHCNLYNELLTTFPNVIDGEIDTKHFLAAARATVGLVDKFGKVFAPIKYDMQTNIEKISNNYLTDTANNSTLQDLILSDQGANKKSSVTDALLWLVRALKLVQLFLEKIVETSRARTCSEDLVANIKESYRESLEPYHGWMAHQLFGLLSRMVPSRTQLLLTLANNQPNREATTLGVIENFVRGLKMNLTVLQNELGIL